uniref:Uncharacterized protein n=1 Tax=Percolomonas cosmopolitus TaxID=63605 RepID=A0A7S1PHS1_9EUKA
MSVMWRAAKDECIVGIEKSDQRNAPSFFHSQPSPGCDSLVHESKTHTLSPHVICCVLSDKIPRSPSALQLVSLRRFHRLISRRKSLSMIRCSVDINQMILKIPWHATVCWLQFVGYVEEGDSNKQTSK